MKKSVKVVLAVVCGLVLLSFGLIVSLFILTGKTSGPDGQGTWYFSDQIVIHDGQLEAEAGKAIIDLNQTGTCNLHVKWGKAGKTYGYLTLMTVKDPAGKVVTWVSGDIVDAELTFEVKEVGDYIAQCSYYMSAEDFKAAVCAIDEKSGSQIKIREDGSYDGFDTFGTEGTWQTDYEIDMEFFLLSLKDKAMALLGILVGIIIIIAAVVMMLLFTKKDGKMKSLFDERQRIVQGNSYKLGFFTLVIWNGLVAVAYYFGIDKMIEFQVIVVLGILVAILVFASYAIWNDAYFALNEKKISLLLIFGIICVVNLFLGLMYLFEGSMIINGKLTVKSLNLLCALLFIGIFSVVLVKTIVDKVKNDEEE